MAAHGAKFQHEMDGSPQTWRSFQREMMWWQSALGLESTKKHNLAARWLLRQSGVVRQRGEELTPEELAYQKEVKGPDPADGQGQVVLTEEDPLSGLKVRRASSETNSTSTPSVDQVKGLQSSAQGSERCLRI